MPIRAVVYASQAAEGLSIDRLKALVADAARFNKLAGVTGVLLHDGTRFVQYFEGPEDGVASVYERVLQSASHTDVVELARGRVSTRQFPYWSMHQLPADQLLVGRLARADWSRFKRSQPEEIAGSAWGIDVLAAAVAPYVHAA
ncbi:MULTISPECIES: BLUF domain-containing protein [Stenotrophomonas]|uniref:BLUF domain-containing protein n=1 Tax=Stenotrophomonas maltophilia TaxID=40324 RepID=A0A2J0SUN7_STEMA|nr:MULTISPECIES: BLUF domain-containing protein [Stenotrophomonas]MBA0310713.1 BLUF domain-containing protein [Stenotrophomonas maltophilia]MBH1744378.1 BLUF domain-containing protein [Stenotrophomonas maltophilia]MDH1387667.1 BLUF domain-containing protein [Stenotrophomonas sp. GD03701]MDH1393284.1 BLUF domain-containing protein [Stenotrophomonas sp. GD03702]MDQ7301755.1 BLUF domain-containing protein [Stenotrophomonas sp. Sm0581]